MTSSPSRPRIAVAIRPEEIELLYDAATLARLHALGEVRILPATGPGGVELPDGLAADHDVLITSWSTAPFDQSAVIGPRLRFAVHTAGSIRGLFPLGVLEQGLRLSQGGAAPMAVPVAEMSLTMTLVLLRDVHSMDRRLQATRDWQAGGFGTLGHSIREQTIGIVSLSRTGREYASMLTGLGVRTVLATDPFVDPAAAAALGVELVGLQELCDRADVLAIHAPATSGTHGLVDAAALARLRDGAIVVNTARSSVLDMQALTAELVAGRLRAGLDVFDQEPLPADDPLFGLDNVLLTPHVAGGTVEARFGQGAGVVDEVEAFLAGRPLRHEVTTEIYDRLG